MKFCAKNRHLRQAPKRYLQCKYEIQRILEIMMKCPICKQNLKESFEHIPPQSCDNNSTVFISNENTFDPNSKFYKRRIKSNRGFGVSNFCERCNKHFGAKYVVAFSSFIDNFKNLDLKNKETTISIKPLNVIKSIYANCSAINFSNKNFPKEFAGYILNENENKKLMNYRVFIRQHSGKFYRTQGWHIDIDIENKILTTYLAKINFPNIEIDVTIDSNLRLPGLEITWFNQYEYNETANIKIHCR